MDQFVQETAQPFVAQMMEHLLSFSLMFGHWLQGYWEEMLNAFDFSNEEIISWHRLMVMSRSLTSPFFLLVVTYLIWGIFLHLFNPKVSGTEVVGNNYWDQFADLGQEQEQEQRQRTNSVASDLASDPDPKSEAETEPNPTRITSTGKRKRKKTRRLTVNTWDDSSYHSESDSDWLPSDYE